MTRLLPWGLAILFILLLWLAVGAGQWAGNGITEWNLP